MNKFLTCAALAGAILSVVSSAEAAGYRYTGIAQAVLGKDANGQLFNEGQVQLARYRNNDASTQSSAPTIRDYYSIESYVAASRALEGTVNSQATINGFELYTGGSKSMTLATADSMSSSASWDKTGQWNASSTFTNLRIYGYPFTPSGAPNEKRSFTVANYGEVIIVFNSERLIDNSRISHSAVRVRLPSGEEYFLAHVTAGSTPKPPKNP